MRTQNKSTIQAAEEPKKRAKSSLPGGLTNTLALPLEPGEMQNWEEGRSGVVVCGGGALSCQYRFDRGERAGQQRNRSNQPKPRWWRDGSEPQQVHAHTQASQCKPKQPNANHQRKPEKNSAAQRNERTAPRPRTGRGNEELGAPAEWMCVVLMEKWPYCHVRTMHTARTRQR